MRYLQKEKIVPSLLSVLKIILFKLAIITGLLLSLVLFDGFLLADVIYLPLIGLYILLAKFIFGYYIVLWLLYYCNYRSIISLSDVSKAYIHLIVATACVAIIMLGNFIFGGSMIDDFFTDSFRITLVLFFAWINSFLAPLAYRFLGK